MRKIMPLFFLNALLFQVSLGQNGKPPLDSSVYGKWEMANGTPTITNDGIYAAYSIENRPLGSNTLIIQGAKSNWKKEYVNTPNCFFTEDSKLALFKNNKDSLFIVKLGTSTANYIPNVSSFEMVQEGNKSFLIYHHDSPQKEMVIRNLKNSSENVYLNVKNYWVNQKEKILVYLSQSSDNGTTTDSLVWMNLEDKIPHTIWTGSGIGNVLLDPEGTRVAFIVSNRENDRAEKTIWLYTQKTSKSSILSSSRDIESESGLEFEGMQRFSKNGDRIFITLKGKEIQPIKNASDVVDVWGYMDTELQSKQLNELNPRTYAAVINSVDHHVIRLEQEGDRIIEYAIHGADNYFAIMHQDVSGCTEINWNPACATKWSIVSTIDGKRTAIDRMTGVRFLKVSGNGRFLIYLDKDNKDCYTYEISSGVIRNIANGIQIVPAATVWIDNDATFIGSDKYDVWMLDPRGERPPLNLTNEYGRRNNIKFTLLFPPTSSNKISSKEKLFFSAFNYKTKENGFYSSSMGKSVNPDSLFMGAYSFYGAWNDFMPLYIAPIKARDKSIYLVNRMSATESPNFFITEDFKSFSALTDIHPEKKYNWYTTELHEWKSLDGSTLQGVLYKPENFDKNKKYPIIFYYYEELSDVLNTFLYPEPLYHGCAINIPYYVSNGYLVFCPDIRYKIGDPMKGTYDAVVSAAKYMVYKGFADSTRMGINGCSWGGVQTNYLVTHTNIFAAASSASGIGDWISGYGSLRAGGNSLQFNYELGQERMGATLWEKPDIYIKNSPIFNVDKVTTPLLLMHTTHDVICPYPNVIEFFTAFRRLGKKSWMLVYDANHGVTGPSANDYSVRMYQFFNHYLKGSQPSFWMTRGIRAADKGVIDGLELDHEIKTPGDGLLIPN